jgi:hypothetical protein
MLTSGAVLLHDARLHTAVHARPLREHFNWELFSRLPHKPGFAPSNYPHKELLGRNYGTEELMRDVKTWLSSQAADTFNTVIQNIIP